MPCTLTMRRIGLPEQPVRKSLLAAGASLFSEGVQHGSGEILIVEAFRRLGGADDMRVRGETAPHGFQQVGEHLPFKRARIGTAEEHVKNPGGGAALPGHERHFQGCFRNGIPEGLQPAGVKHAPPREACFGHVQQERLGA